MRAVLRRIQQKKRLTEDEYTRLISYSEDLRWNYPESYQLFYDLYVDLLFQDYDTFLPQFRYGRDDFYDYLLQNPDLFTIKPGQTLTREDFPPHLHEYLYKTYGNEISPDSIKSIQFLIVKNDAASLILPAARTKEPVYKYEAGNPYKEPGLKNHFERIGRYSFVSRIQSYRYLRGSKSTVDKIEVLSPDCLGGIFTNKEKSIYYYIFLTEEDYPKAINACRVLNAGLYGR